LQASFANEADVRDVTVLDGARVNLDGGWGIVRASNTEPAITTRFEGVTPERVAEIRQWFMDRLSKIPAVDLHRAAGH
jgi:phosphomannomutase